MSAITDTAPVPATRTATGAPRRKRSERGNIVLAVLAWLIGILFVLPALWMVLTSFHSEADAATNPPSFAAPLTLHGYRKKWTDVLFFFLSTKMLPVVAGLLPIYLFAQKAGLLDNIWLLIVFYTSMNLPIAVWMIRSFLAEVPIEMLEAASLDGAGLSRTLRSVVAPVVAPGIAATALICFIFSWNELLFARVLTATVAQTAPVFLTSFVTSQGLFLAKVCAAAVVVSLPMITAGFAAQDKLVQGLSLGAVK